MAEFDKAEEAEDDRSMRERGSLARHLWMLAPGIWLAWLWLAVGGGLCNPADTGGYLQAGAPIALLAASVALAAVALKPSSFAQMANRLPFVTLTGVLASLSSGALSMQAVTNLSWGLDWVLCAIAGASGAIVLLLCARGYARIGVEEAFSALHYSLLSMALAYFITVSFFNEPRSLAFALLPLIAALLAQMQLPAAGGTEEHPSQLFREKDAGRTQLVEMSIGFLLLFLTVGFVRSFILNSMLSQSAIHRSSAPAIALVALLSIAIIFVDRRRGFAVSCLKGYYIFAALGVAFATTAMAFAVLESDSVQVLTNVAHLLLMAVVWCCLVAAVSIHQKPALPTFGLLLALLCASTALGWILHSAIATLYGDSNAFVALFLALGFLDFAYFMFGFPPATLTAYIRKEESPATAAPITASSSETPDMDHSGLSFRDASLKIAEEAGLTKREHEVFMLLARGDSSKRIAELLVVSYHTVRAHVRNIYTKIDVHDRQEMLDKINSLREASWENEDPANPRQDHRG